MHLRLISPDHTAALTDPQTWRDNPFVWREQRRDRTRKQPTKSFAWMAFTLSTVGITVAIAAVLLERSRIAVTPLIGGDITTVYFYAIAGVHVWFVIAASRKHTGLMLAREYHRNTLSSILLLPLPPFQFLVESSVYPWLVAMRAALVLLPIYVFLTALGAVTWLDLAMLYLLFAMLSVTCPNWRRPVLSENAPVGLPVQTSSAAQSRSTQQAMAQASGQSAAGAWIMIALYLPMAIGAKIMFGSAGIGGLYDALHPYLPTGVIDLMLSSMLSWPLLLARLLVAPLDWFGWTLPPLPVVLVLTALIRYTSLVRTAELLSVGYYRDIASLPTYQKRRRLEGIIRIATTVFLTGYLWKWGVVNGGLGIVTAAGHSPGETGMIGFIALLLVITLWRGMRRAGTLAAWSVAWRKQGAMAAGRITTVGATRFILDPFIGGAFVYLFACLAARTNPLLHSAGPIACEILGIGLSGMALAGCMGALWGALGTFIGVPIVITWYALYITYSVKGALSLAYLSPFLGMLHAARLPILEAMSATLATTNWLQWLKYCGGLSLMLAAPALTALMRARHARAVLDSPMMNSMMDPTIVGTIPFGDAGISAKRAAETTDTPLAVRLVAVIQRRMDNPVAIKEMRVRFRGKLEARAVRAFISFAIITSVVLVLGAPAIPETFGSAVAQTLYGAILTGPVLTIASLTCCLFYILLMVPVIYGFTTFSAFYTEREKSTLGFVLLTPLPPRSIVAGKLIGILSAGMLVTLFVAAWSLALTLMVLPKAGAAALLVWMLVVATSIVTTTMLASCTLALVSHFPKLSPQYIGCFFAVGSQVVVQGAIFGGRYLPTLLSGMSREMKGASIYATWAVGLFCAMLITWIALLVAGWGVRRMRAADLTFTASAQEN